MKGKGEKERQKMWGLVSATTHNTHCGRGWINSSEDGTWWCNPQPRIMEHRNLKDNALSEQRAREPERGRDASYRGRCFHCAPLSNILRQQQAETHFGLSWQKMEPFEAEKVKGIQGSKHRYEDCWRSEVVSPAAEQFSEFSSFLKNEVITMLRTLEEDIKPIVPSLIYISHAFY